MLNRVESPCTRGPKGGRIRIVIRNWLTCPPSSLNYSILEKVCERSEQYSKTNWRGIKKIKITLKTQGPPQLTSEASSNWYFVCQKIEHRARLNAS